MSVINVVALHRDQELTGDRAKLIAEAAFRWELGHWREEWRRAAEALDYGAMDRLDRAYERIGLP